MTITLHLNRPYQPLPPDLDSFESTAHEWRDVLKWCFFLNKPVSEVLEGCGYDPVYFPLGFTPGRLPKKDVRKLVKARIGSLQKSKSNVDTPSP